MGTQTGIQWTTRTWNPWQGCHKVSPGCAHCYMFRDKTRYGQDPNVVGRSKPATFFAPLKWPHPTTRQERLVFTCSWSDWFVEEADPWREAAWDVIRSTPQFIYQILTKRPERIDLCLPPDWGSGWMNVWLGVSTENQAMLTRRLPLLLDVPADVRFLSAEPLLGPLHIQQALDDAWATHRLAQPALDLDWVIIGGESGGSEARPMDLAWVRDLVAQCQAARIAPFVKQLGSVWARSMRLGAPLSHGGDPDLWPADLRQRRFPWDAMAVPV